MITSPGAKITSSTGSLALVFFRPVDRSTLIAFLLLTCPLLVVAFLRAVFRRLHVAIKRFSAALTYPLGRAPVIWISFATHPLSVPSGHALHGAVRFSHLMHGGALFFAALSASPDAELPALVVSLGRVPHPASGSSSTALQSVATACPARSLPRRNSRPRPAGRTSRTAGYLGGSSWALSPPHEVSLVLNHLRLGFSARTLDAG